METHTPYPTAARPTGPATDSAHYHHTAGQPLDLLTPDEQRAFYKGNIIKYVARYQYKDGIRDLRKAAQYLQWLTTLEEMKQCGNETTK